MKVVINRHFVWFSFYWALNEMTAVVKWRQLQGDKKPKISKRLLVLAIN